MKKTKEQKAITLIALIITIVVLLILAAVAITAITQYNIIENANSAAQKYGDQADAEGTTLGSYNTEIDKYMGGAAGGNGSGEETGSEGSGEGEGTGSVEGPSYESGNVSGEIISKETDYSKCYADVDGDGDIDGIIYADLAFHKSDEWVSWGTNGNYAYSYDAKSTLNNYTVRDATTDEQGYFKGATAKVIAPTGNQTEENDRFYVMALSNFTTEGYTTFCWYYNAYGKMDPLVTEVGFETGRENTNKMIEIWNKNGEDGGYAGATQRDEDMWKHIQGEVVNGWFVPSRAEWAAFLDTFSINNGNYAEYGLGGYYWSSSQMDDMYTWRALLDDCFEFDFSVDIEHYVRLGTTF